MNAQFAERRKTEPNSGRGTRRLALLPGGTFATQARGDPLPDPGGGMHGRARDEQRTPRTEGRARRSAFRGIDRTSGQIRVSGIVGTVPNDRCPACGPAPKPGPLAPAPGTRPANRPGREPVHGRKRLRTRNSCASSDSCAALREGEARYSRAGIARDSSRYHEQDCQGSSFWTLAGNARCKGRSMVDRPHPVEKTALLTMRPIDSSLSGIGPGAPERRIIARDNCFGNPGLAGGFRRPPRGAGPYPTPQHHNPAATSAHRCADQSRRCIRASCAMPLRRASSLSP